MAPAPPRGMNHPIVGTPLPLKPRKSFPLPVIHHGHDTSGIYKYAAWKSTHGYMEQDEQDEMERREPLREAAERDKESGSGTWPLTCSGALPEDLHEDGPEPALPLQS